LAEVNLNEGLVEIGVWSFGWCDHSITKINIPTSLRRINEFAFVALFELIFVCTMALTALEKKHSLAASSPTLESRPSSPGFPKKC
jgi:hypothetical protein